jgi:hypothetical protein
MLLPGAALAQSESELETALEACLEIEDDSARLACFDSVRRPGPAESAPGASIDAPEPEPAVVADDALEHELEVVADDAPDSPVPPGAPTEPASERDVVAVEAQEASGSRVRSDEEEGFNVIITEVRRNQLGSTTFVTADGEVYAKISRISARYPPVPFEAELRPAARGSYFLVTSLGGPRVRVSRRD